jgi:hypothetical protein
MVCQLGPCAKISDWATLFLRLKTTLSDSLWKEIVIFMALTPGVDRSARVPCVALLYYGDAQQNKRKVKKRFMGRKCAFLLGFLRVSPRSIRLHRSVNQRKSLPNRVAFTG